MIRFYNRDSERSESRTPSPTVTVHMDIPLTGAVTEFDTANTVNTATGAGAGNADDEGQSTDTFSITDGQSSTSVTSHDHDTSPVYSTTECSDKDEIKSAVEVFMASLLERYASTSHTVWHS